MNITDLGDSRACARNYGGTYRPETVQVGATLQPTPSSRARDIDCSRDGCAQAEGDACVGHRLRRSDLHHRADLDG